MLLTNLPPYELSNVIRPVEANGTNILWLENGDVEITNATDEQIDLIKRAIYVAAGVAYVPEEAYEAQTGAKAWYLSTPNAALLFELSIDGLIAEIDSLDFTALPAATRNKLKLLLKTLAVAVRVLAKREGLV